MDIAIQNMKDSGLENQYSISLTPFDSPEKKESIKMYNELKSLGLPDDEIQSQVKNEFLSMAQAQFAYENQAEK